MDELRKTVSITIAIQLTAARIELRCATTKNGDPKDKRDRFSVVDSADQSNGGKVRKQCSRASRTDVRLRNNHRSSSSTVGPRTHRDPAK